jgi:hypothetical protein
MSRIEIPPPRRPAPPGCNSRFANPLIWITAFLATAAGCVSTAPSPANYTVRTTTLTDRGEILDSVEIALIDRGYVIERRDDRAGVITTYPIESMPSEPSLRHSRVIRSPTPIRTRAEIRLEPAGASLRIHCKVVVQEQDTEAARMFALQRGGYDTPRDTPIDRDAATTEEQNAYWRTVRRDKNAERAILDSVQGTVMLPQP